MAVIVKPPSGKLYNKVSPLIDGQLPDFIQSDHPVFSRFLKHYYQYLEAGELQLTVTIDKLQLNLETASYVLNVDGSKIVLEDGAGTSGKFVVGDTITGGTSKATATVLVDNLDNATTPRLFITSQQKFVTGETVTGAISGSGTVDRYRANPIQTIQQLLDYADIDNTLYDFLDNFRDEFMNAIPLTLADGVSKRRLLKNIRELYRAKGTSEGHKIFMRLLLGETPEIIYPEKYMIRASDGKWGNQTIIRTTPGANAVASEVIGSTITGDTSGATAVIASAVEFVEGSTLIVEFELNPDSLNSLYSFVDGENVVATSTVQDFPMSFTIRNIVSEATVTDRGALYAAGDPAVFDTNANIGNGLAEARIENLNEGWVSGVFIEDAGTGYKVGDALTFSTVTDTKPPEGFVSIIDGSIVLEGTSKYYTDDNARRIDENDFILLENGTNRHYEYFEVELETATTGDPHENLLLDGTDAVSANAGHKISMQWPLFQNSADTYGTAADRWVLEEGTAADLSFDGGSIQGIYLRTGGGGFLTLPTVTIAAADTVDGTGASLITTTDNIGSVGDMVIKNEGFGYSSAPFMEFRANLTLKDVTGTFTSGNDLVYPYVGEVKAYDSSTQVLSATFKDVVRIPLETGDSEGILLEENDRVATDFKHSEIKLNRTTDTDEKIVDEQSGERIVLNATSTNDAHFVLEDGVGETAGSAVVYEQPDAMYNPPMRLELATDTIYGAGGISLEDGVRQGLGAYLAANAVGDVIVIETEESIGSPSTVPGHQLEKMLLEGNKNIPGGLFSYDVISGAGDYLVTNYSIDESDSNVIFNGTDQYYTDEGSIVLDEETGDNNVISLNGTDSDGTDANAKLLQDVDTASGTDLLVLDGIDSSSTGAADSIVHENYIDLLAGATGVNPTPLSITDDSGATGKIVKANIARGTSTIATTVETNKSYGVDIESLIGEDLNRIQDSYYYQQFSYEVQTGFGHESYLSKLKKAVHPAGFAVFSKVKIASSVSAGVQAAGSRLGDDIYDPILSPDERFSPILASTFEILFDEPIQRRFGVPIYNNVTGDYEKQIILEDSESQDNNPGDAILAESSISPPTYMIEESPTHTDGRIMLEVHTGGHGAVWGQLVLNGTDASSTNAGDTFILESSEEYTSNLVFDGTEDYGYYSDAGSDILLDGTDSSKSNAGSSFELEDANMGIEFKRFGLYDRPPTSTLLNESGGTMQTEESSVGGGMSTLSTSYDNSVVSYVTAKIDLPLLPNKYSNSLVDIGRTPFINSRSGIQLEKATGGDRLVMDWNYVSVIGRSPRLDSQGYTAGGPGYAVEHGFNPIDESAAIALEDSVLGIPSNDYGYTFADIESCTNGYTMSDIIRSSILVIDSEPKHYIGSHQDSPSGILLEVSGVGGKFKQEDAATAAGGVSYDILLEEGVGFGLNNKLIFEETRIEVEDSINQGTIPHQNYTNSTLHPWTRPAHVTTSEYGGVALEDSIEGQLLINATDGSASDAGSKFKFEIFTDDFTHDSAAFVHFAPTFGRFDSTVPTWDSVSLGKSDWPESAPKTFDQPY